MKPVLLVIAGPNGAGKTTVTTRLRADHWSEGARAADGQLRKTYGSMPAWVEDALRDAPRHPQFVRD